MSLYKRKKNGKEIGCWYYLFYINGKRYKGSTETKNAKEAERIASRKRVAAEKGESLNPPKPRTLGELMTEFSGWVEKINRAPKTIADYQNGCRLILASPLAGMRADHVTKDDVETTAFNIGTQKEPRYSPYSTNCALRTLRRALRRALEKKILLQVPKFHLLDAPRRERLVTDQDEARLLKAINHAAECRRYKKRPPSPLDDVLVQMLDSGMRDGEVVRMEIPYINWTEGYYFNPKGKTKRARRRVPLSKRCLARLRVRCDGRREGWVFPSKKSRSGHIELRGLQKQFRKIADQLGIPRDLKLYCSRHTFGTVTMDETKNPYAVRDAMGHEDLDTTMTYMHNDVMQLKTVIDKRNESKTVQ